MSYRKSEISLKMYILKVNSFHNDFDTFFSISHINAKYKSLYEMNYLI